MTKMSLMSNLRGIWIVFGFFFNVFSLGNWYETPYFWWAAEGDLQLYEINSEDSSINKAIKNYQMEIFEDFSNTGSRLIL